MTKATVWCDGSGLAMGGDAGIAFVAATKDGWLERSLHLDNGTNQQAELLAAAFALSEIRPHAYVKVWSDSEYLVKGFTEWLDGWIARQWRTSSGKPVKNQSHWKRLIEAVSRHGVVEMEWCRGHDGVYGNELADKLAVAARMGWESRY